MDDGWVPIQEIIEAPKEAFRFIERRKGQHAFERVGAFAYWEDIDIFSVVCIPPLLSFYGTKITREIVR